MQLITWAFRYVVTNNEVILAEVDFNQEGLVDGWCSIDECDREEAVKEASGFLPINVDDMAVPCYSWANHPEIMEVVEDAYEEALMKKLEEEEELYKRRVREQAMADGMLHRILERLRREREALAPSTTGEVEMPAPAPTVFEFKVRRAPSLAPKRVAQPTTPLIQKWIEKHQEPKDLSGEILELKVVNPNAFSGVLDRLINGVLHSFTYEEKGDKLNMAEKTLPKATRARGNNSKPKGKRPWRENR